jgi:two-component system, response regulator YesN
MLHAIFQRGVIMKKVLIVDDEILVRVGLKSAINWEENGYMVVGEAKNGKEAVSMFDKYNPDILITDISMPFMNGLELIEVLKQKKQSLKVIILTHYEDFNYAQEAVQLGVIQYILKSQLSPDGLLKVLKKISKDMKDSDRSSYFSQQQNNELVEKSIRDLELYKIITGKVKIKEELEITIQNYGTQFLFNSFVIAYALIPSKYIEGSPNKEDSAYFRKVLENVSQQVLITNEFSIDIVIKGNKILYLFNFNIENLEGSIALEKIIKLMGSVKNNIGQFLNLQLSIGVSSIGNCLENLNKLYHEAKTAQEYNFFDMKIHVFNRKLQQAKPDIPVIDSGRLKKYIIDRSKEEVSSYLDEIFNLLFISKNIEYVRRIFIDLLNQAKLLYSQLSNDKISNVSELDYDVFNQLYNFELIKKYILEIYYDLFLCYQNKQAKGYSHIVRKIIHYIEENYKKDISLSNIADHVQLSSSYLSFLFKRETGVNFSSFLAEFRIEKAKLLLTESNKKIYEIAEEVGLDNPYYFSKIFKEITGMTCKEYRSSYYK